MSSTLHISHCINQLTHRGTLSVGRLLTAMALLGLMTVTSVFAKDPPKKPEDLSAGLVSFNAKEKNRDVVITWETSGEMRGLLFEIQRRESISQKWQVLGKVEGRGKAFDKSYSYVDSHAGVGSLQYRLKQLNNDGSFLLSPALEIQIAPKQASSLGPDTLTEFNPGTFIRYELSETSYVKLVIFNTDGEPVRTLVNGEKGAGNYAVRWDGKNEAGKDLATGSYFYTLKIYGDPIVSKQMLTIK